MKSLEELMAIKQKMQDKVAVRNAANDSVRVVVAGLATKVSVTQTGCIGLCQYEPIVEVYEKDKEKVTYIKMTAEKAKEVVEKHLKGGKVIGEYTIGTTSL